MKKVNGNEDKNAQLRNIVAEVEKTRVIPGLKGNELVVFSDIEGKPCELLEKLKSAGVIDSVNNVNGKIEIKLNPEFHGTINFCGDLTSYKTHNGEVLIERPYGNEIVIEVFEALLGQIKEHNKGKDKKQQIQFVAVPGNHEFLECCGIDDLCALAATDVGIDEKCKNITKTTSLLAKIKGLKVIAEIQKYFLEQACKNKDDIADDDYYPDYNENKILADIKLLGEDIEKLKGMKNNIDKCLKQVSEYVKFVRLLLDNKNACTEDSEKQQKEKDLYKKWEATLAWLKKELGPLFWKNSNVLLKMVFCHQNKKFRTLHSFSLFTPKDYLNKDCTDKCANEEKLKQQQKAVYSKAFKDRYLNDEGIEKKKLPTKQCFSDNYVPTLVGHEGGMSPDRQTESVYCVDHRHEYSGGLVFIVDENNYIKPYYTEKMLRYMQDKGKQKGEKKYGDVFGDGKRLKILSNKELECEPEKVKTNISAEENLLFDEKQYLQAIENYVNAGAGERCENEGDIANIIESLIDNNKSKQLENYSRTFAFSQKDKRAQQVYQTYRRLVVGRQKIYNDNIKNKPQMFNLSDVRSINTPCGSCC